MAKKRKGKKTSLVVLVAFAVMCVLAALNCVLPLVTSEGGASVGSFSGSSGKVEYGLFDLLEGMSDKNISDMSDLGTAAKANFFSNEDKTQARWFAVLSLVTAIVAVVGVALAVVALFVPKAGKCIKAVGGLLAVLAIVSFVFAIVVTSVFTSSASFIVTVSITVQLAIGSILSLVGGIGAAVVPFVLK